MKVPSVPTSTLLGALAVLAAPKLKPFPGEFAMVEARAVFEGSKGSGPPGTDSEESDSVPPHPKVSVNPGDTGKMFKRQACPGDFWYCDSVKTDAARLAPSLGAVTLDVARPGTTAVVQINYATRLGHVRICTLTSPAMHIKDFWAAAPDSRSSKG